MTKHQSALAKFGAIPNKGECTSKVLRATALRVSPLQAELDYISNIRGIRPDYF